MTEPTKRGTGPGGVGVTDGNSKLRLWLKADVDVTTRGDYVLQWLDQSGNQNNAVQLKTQAQPTLTANNPRLNNMPTIHFNGRDQFLRVNHANSLNMRDAMSAFMVVQFTDLTVNHGLLSKTMPCENYCSYSLAVKADRRQLWFQHYDLNWWRFSSMGTISKRPTILSFWYDSTIEQGEFRLNGQNVGEFASARKLATNREPLEIGVHAHCKNEGDWFSGDLAEVIIFEGTLNLAQQIIVENYLAAKYGIVVPSTNLGKDVYEGDLPENGAYILDVAGIGRESNGTNDTATSAGLTIIDRTFLKDNGDYLIFGHKSPTNNLLTSELPEEVNQRWEREWYLDCTDVGNNSGKLTFMFDCALAEESEAITEGTYALLSRPDRYSPFNVVQTAEASTSNTVSFNLEATDLQVGRYYTLGRIIPVSIIDKFIGRLKGFFQSKEAEPVPQPVQTTQQPTQRRTLHERRNIQLVSRTQPLLDKANELTADDVKWALSFVLDTISPEVPGDIRGRVERIQESILGTLPYIADVASSNHTVYVVRQIALEYLPQTLENYLNLPPQFANMEPLKEGKTARELLLEQLDLLNQEMQEVVTQFHRQDAEKLMVHGRFLDEKFGRHSDSLLD